MVDPISVLPFETITKIFALLSTPNLAISGSTSREWRSQILTDPIINKTIDLQGLSLSEKETIELVDRLVSLSTHPDLQVGKELHLDLGCFYESIEEYGEGLRDDDNIYASLLKTIFSATKGQLSKLFLNLPNEGILSAESLKNVMMKTASMLDGPLFKELRWVAAFPIAVVSKSEDNSRVFSLESDLDCCPHMQALALRDFLRAIVQFTGGGLTRLSIDWTCIEFNSNEADPQGSLGDILCEVQKSQQSMKDLDMYVPPQSASEVFQLIENLGCLSSLRLEVDPDRGHPGHLSLPKGSMSSHLKKLDLTLPQTTVEMGWLAGWVGSDLESLRIRFSSSPPIVTKLPKSVLSSIFETCLSLKSLVLLDFVILSDSSSSSSSSFQPSTLPNLESLSIGSLGLAGYEIFAKCSMPKLESLNFSADKRGFVDKETASQVMEHLLTIVKRCSLTLVKLRLDKIIQPEGSPSSEPQNVSKIALLKLKDLTISSSDVTAIQFLQGFKFQLNRLSLSDSTASIQFVYQFFLEPNSQILEDVTLDCVGKGSTLSESALMNIKNNKLSFPKLKSLSVESENRHDLVEIFAGAVFGELTDLKLSTSDMPFPKSVASLLATSASSLTSLALHGHHHGLYEKTDFDNPGLEFPNLVALSIHATLFSPLQLLLRSNFPKISNLYIHCPKVEPNSSQAQVSIHQVLNLLRKCSPTIKDVDLHIEHFDKTEDFQHQLFFPKLRRFVCYHDLDFLGALLGMDRLSLLGLDSEERSERMQEKMTKIAPGLIDGIGEYM